MEQGSPQGHLRSSYRYGEKLATRRGIYGGPLNLRRQGTVKELRMWLDHYRKEIQAGRFCPIRGQKIVDHFEMLLAKKTKRRHHV